MNVLARINHTKKERKAFWRRCANSGNGNTEPVQASVGVLSSSDRFDLVEIKKYARSCESYARSCTVMQDQEGCRRHNCRHTRRGAAIVLPLSGAAIVFWQGNGCLRFCVFPCIRLSVLPHFRTSALDSLLSSAFAGRVGQQSQKTLLSDMRYVDRARE